MNNNQIRALHNRLFKRYSKRDLASWTPFDRVWEKGPNTKSRDIGASKKRRNRRLRSTGLCMSQSSDCLHQSIVQTQVAKGRKYPISPRKALNAKSEILSYRLNIEHLAYKFIEPIIQNSWASFISGLLDELLDFILRQKLRSFRSHDHEFDVLISWLDDVQKCLYNQLGALFGGTVVLVVLLQELTDLFGVSSAWLGLPLGKGTWGVGIIQMGLVIGVEPGHEGWNSKRSDTALLGVFLFGLSDVLGDVFNWWVVVIVEAVGLALDSGFIGKNSAVGCETWKCHVNILI